jgi:hypothetical protein
VLTRSGNVPFAGMEAVAGVDEARHAGGRRRPDGDRWAAKCSRLRCRSRRRCTSLSWITEVEGRGRLVPALRRKRVGVYTARALASGRREARLRLRRRRLRKKKNRLLAYFF